MGNLAAEGTDAVRRGKATRCRFAEHDGGQATELRMTTRLAGSR